ncbi:MAG: trigger factor [Lentisphaeria bacterium]|nr:trigger factor [Lentisphaeria bacterium]
MAIDTLLEKVQIDVKETDACTRKMDAKYTADVVDAAFKDAVKEAGKYAQLPGFRKGKAPASLILSKYKDYILDDVTKVLQQGAFRKLTENKDLDIVSFGQIKAEAKPESGKEYAFSLEVEVAPEIKLPEYKGLKVKVEEKETLDQHYEAQLKYIKNLYAEFLSVEDPAVNGDMLKVSYESDLEVPEDASASLKRAAKAAEAWFYLTEPEQIPGMLKAMTGAKKGDEVKFKADFPADWREPGLAGKSVNYTVKVVEVQRRVPIESEEKLAEKLGMENVEKMHDFLKKKAENELEEARKAQIREKVADQLISAVADFEMPKGVLGMAAQREFSRIADQLVRKEEDVEKFKADKDKHLEDARKAAAARMKRFFILRKIAHAENITVSEEEVDMQIRQMSAYLGYKEKDVRKMLDSNGGYTEIQSDILMGKVIDFLAKQAKV